MKQLLPILDLLVLKLEIVFLLLYVKNPLLFKLNFEISFTNLYLQLKPQLFLKELVLHSRFGFHFGQVLLGQRLMLVT